MPQYTVKARITGRVQGVAFRAWTQSRAQALGLAGWVRNENDNAVTAVLQGDRDTVRAMVKELWSGPGAAAVDNVQTEEISGSEALNGFDIRF